MAATERALLTIGVTAAVALTQFRAVTAAGAIPAAKARACGFTKTSGAVGERVPATAIGQAIATAGAAVAVGDKLEVVGAAGKVQPVTDGVGVAYALTAAAADGDLIEVIVIPN